MEEVYRFPARVVEVWRNGQIQITPEDVTDYMAHRARANHRGNENWANNPIGPFVTVSNLTLTAQTQGAQRVMYSVQARGQGQNRQMWGVDLQSL